jgi:hypothetical protein
MRVVCFLLCLISPPSACFFFPPFSLFHLIDQYLYAASDPHFLITHWTSAFSLPSFNLPLTVATVPACPSLAMQTVSAAEHKQRVQAVVTQVQSRPKNLALTVRKSTVTHTVRDQRYKKDAYPVDVSALNGILQVSTDPQHPFVVAEGQVTLGRIVQVTTALGYVPLVVPEYPNFTVAGLVNGGGLQSTSHKYGVFRNSVDHIEVSTVRACVTAPDLIIGCWCGAQMSSSFWAMDKC